MRCRCLLHVSMFPRFHVVRFWYATRHIAVSIEMYASTCFSPLYPHDKPSFKIIRGHCSLPEDPPVQLSHNPVISGSKSLQTTSTLDSLLSDCIDQVLSDLVGGKAKEAFYDYMERNYAVAREDIPRNFGKFYSLTEEVCGKGSRTIARCIMKRLWERLGWTFVDMPDFMFSDFLETTRARIARELVEKA